MKVHPLISSTDELRDLCDRFATADFVAVDTEFMRESTYWPLLCLVQISDGKEAAAIDPLAQGIDLTPLLDLLCENEDVLKVFHAGGQDVEIIYNLTGKTPHPIFDTQIAMMAISQSEQIGYSNLVESWLGHAIDKGARFTDWSRRPLTERQLEYAVGDVTYLSKIFPKMLKKLIKTGRGIWLDHEMERLADPANYAQDPDTLWHRIRAPGRNPQVLGRLKALAAWRENEAQDKDIPRGRIVRDETLADLASHPPKKQADLAKVRGLSNGWKDNDIGKRLMKVLDAAEPLPAEEMPERKRGAPLGKEGALVADLLKLLLKIRSREIDVASRLLARSDDLEQLAAGVRKKLPLLEGWRFEEFGRDALDLVEGKLGFGVENGRLKMTRIGEGPVAPTPENQQADDDGEQASQSEEA
ncbi:ribonuclease D [Croceicoccus naphthovorans]|uniref:Ribonuclease D n=1 Tax=Croceicoccus naphthovorans TaxID=1348774 RepID=A0A0G3XFS6_9SPHN|nr:ribonuclease D [Croceicoccus naphthovorans]AKM10390.1 ribonuclease D [Croceicoccus naphthovorans]MBB3990087.1 ribonuclease D [Croceicoccus naphthovorans]